MVPPPVVADWYVSRIVVHLANAMVRHVMVSSASCGSLHELLTPFLSAVQDCVYFGKFLPEICGIASRIYEILCRIPRQRAMISQIASMMCQIMSAFLQVLFETCEILLSARQIPRRMSADRYGISVIPIIRSQIRTAICKEAER